MFIRNKACAIATAAGLTTSAWYVLGNLAALILTNNWIAQERAAQVIPYISHLFLMVQPPFAAFTGLTPTGFSIVYFLVGLVQIFVVTYLAVWITAQLYRLVRKD